MEYYLVLKRNKLLIYIIVRVNLKNIMLRNKQKAHSSHFMSPFYVKLWKKQI